MDEQQFIILRKENPAAWALMPHAIDRIKRFCVTYGTDLNPEVVAQLVQSNFISDKPMIMIVVGYRRDIGVFCHAMGVIDDITGNRFLTIVQFESDIPFADRKQVAEMWKEFEKFGLLRGAKEAQLVTSSPKLVDVFEKRYGFKQHRFMMRKELKG